jgi:hypothetical protein
VNGESHGRNAPAPPSLQPKLTSGSSDQKPNVGLRSDEVEPSAGPEEIDAVGGVVSTVHVRDATWVFWAISVALTRKVCEPSAKPEAVNGELQSAKAPPSSWQLTLAPGSLEVKSNEWSGLDQIEPSAGPAEIFTVGAVVSTVKNRVRTALSFPGASIALTLRVCGPSCSGEATTNCEPHGDQLRAKRHSKVEPGSLEASWNAGVESLMKLPWVGPEAMRATGGMVSAVKPVNAL